MTKKTGIGLEACVKAFERLVSGNPIVADHVGLPSTKITSGIVSVEAGFDRGYLKAARPSHQSLIARINAHRTDLRHSNTSTGFPSTQHLRAAKEKIEALEKNLSIVSGQRDAVIAHTCQLHEKVRVLEQTLNKRQPELGYLNKPPTDGAEPRMLELSCAY